MTFLNKYIEKIYKYIYIHDGQFLLIKEMSKDLQITEPTIRKYIRWLERRELIKKTGKKFEIIPI